MPSNCTHELRKSLYRHECSYCPSSQPSPNRQTCPCSAPARESRCASSSTRCEDPPTSTHHITTSLPHLEIGLWGSVQLADGHESHEVEVWTVSQNELCQRNTLFGEASALPTPSAKAKATTFPLHSCGPQRRRSRDRRAQQERRRN